ncbi:MAG: hypothetical protein P8P74_03935 [Crocinitomicaceae bacterium]|nr:hypothetical protein [Crocinitomicaceae bacterium]
MKTNKLKFGVMIMAASLALGTVSCKKGCTDPTSINYDDSAKKDDGSCIETPIDPVGNEIPKAGFIQSETWTAGNVYVLKGKVVVESGHTLTIEPGTIVKANEGSGTLASALVVRQGARINAVGTATEPIIFTSILDNIQPGELTGTNLSETDQGLWGGIVVLGYAPISAADGDNVAQIEGFPVTDQFGAFGGSDVADNSGTMSYVSIRHGGALIGAGNEINGLTLGGVGSGTSISNIEIVSNLDDGVEFFGGTVNVTNVLVGFQGDDGIDIDMNYAGTVSNFMVINGNNSDEAMEVDGPEGSTHTTGLFTLENGTVYTFGGADARGDFKSKAQGTITNVKMGEAKIRASYQNDCNDPKTDAFTYLTQTSPILTFVGSEFSAATVYTASQDDAAVNDCTVFPADQTAAEGVMTSTTATGATSSAFSGWTWCSVNGKL